MKLLSIRNQRGLTLIEMVVGMAITGLLSLVLVTAMYVATRRAPEAGDRAVALNDLQQAVYWLNRDASSAQSFTALAAPDYAAFSWPEHTGATVVNRVITYTRDGTGLVRIEKSGDTVLSTRPVARHLLDYSDLSLSFDSTNRLLAATITATIPSTETIESLVLSTTLRSALRSQILTAAPTPGPAPTPTPVPGQVTVRCGANPTLLTGTFISGGCDPQLFSDDTSYYIINSGGGAIKTVEWEVTSEVITQTTVSGVTVVFIGQTTKANVTQSFFVFGSGGYPSTPDFASTYPSSDTDMQVRIDYTQEQLDFLNTLTGTNKKARVKLNATLGSDYTHRGDMIVWLVN